MSSRQSVVSHFGISQSDVQRSAHCMHKNKHCGECYANDCVSVCVCNCMVCTRGGHSDATHYVRMWDGWWVSFICMRNVCSLSSTQLWRFDVLCGVCLDYNIVFTRACAENPISMISCRFVAVAHFVTEVTAHRILHKGVILRGYERR